MPATPSQIRDRFFAASAQLSRQWRRVLDRELQPLGLTEATWLPLIHLSRAAEPMRQKDLASSLSLDSSSVVRLLDALEEAGLVERLGHADRRAKTLGLTKRGHAVVEQVERIARAARKRMLANVAEAELATAYAVLERVTVTLAESLESGA